MEKTQTRNKLFTMKISEAEREKWKAISENMGISLAELFRKILSDEKLQPPKKRKPKPVPKADPELLRQLAGLGNNLNQITRNINYAVQDDKQFEALALLYSIERDMRKILDAHQIY